MIQINLLPGASRKAKGRGAGISLGTMFGDAQSSVRDPWMMGAVASIILAVTSVGIMYQTQTSHAAELAAHEELAVADSVRFASVLRQRSQAEAKRDSVQRQLDVIRAIDADRFIWPHVMDEVSRALPPYTWLKTITASAPQLPPSSGTGADSSARAESEPTRFRIAGNTVDIQALTRFMKLLEASPFIQKVQLARSELALVDGKEVTEFQLDAQYERPDPAAISTAPISLSVR